MYICIEGPREEASSELAEAYLVSLYALKYRLEPCATNVNPMKSYDRPRWQLNLRVGSF